MEESEAARALQGDLVRTRYCSARIHNNPSPSPFSQFEKIIAVRNISKKRIKNSSLHPTAIDFSCPV